MTWKKNEKEMLNSIKKHIESLSDLKQSSDRYRRYDASNDLAIVELKYRKAKYDDTLIEKSKYEALKTYCHGKIAIYAVQADNTIYLFNLNRLHKDEWNYKWENRDCNKTSEFYGQANNRSKVSKTVGYIDWDQADIIIEIDTGDIIRREKELP